MILKQVILYCCLLGLISWKADGQTLVPNFTSSVTSGCGPLSVAFTDQTAGGPNYWEWDFGNGQISSQQNPSTTFLNPGQYTVTLIVRNASGTNSIRKVNYITVFPYPKANFSSSANQGVACAPANIQFKDLSTPQDSIVSRLWSLGDNTSSTSPNPVHSYSQTGYYTIGLLVTNNVGCSNTIAIARYLRIIPGVQANFAWNQISPSCSAPYTLFYNNQTAGPGNLSYVWNLGNGNTSGLQNPSSSYPSNGNYTVTLTAYSDLGCQADTQEVITLSPASPLIVAPDSACVNTPVNFTNGSTPPPPSAAWSFGDGSGSVSTNPTKTYTNYGTYAVKLVNSYGACTDSITKPLAITAAPTANFTATSTSSCQAPFTANFQDQSIGATSWQWDFGDGSPVSNQRNPTHIYTNPGSYTVTLTASIGAGCPSTIAKTNFIQIVAPTISLTQNPETGCTGIPTPLSASINTVDPVTSYLWTAQGANAPNTSTVATPSFTWTAEGYYNVSLTVTTSGGCSVTTNFPNGVQIGTPITPAIAIPTKDTAVCANQPITFQSNSTPANTLVWNFGDSTAGSGSPAMHAYTDTGYFSVTLTQINAGCKKNVSLQIHVNSPIANFGSTVNCSNKKQVQFTDSSKLDQSGPATYVWNFGDGTPLVTYSGMPPLPPPSHIFSAYGNYTVTLSVTNGSCTDTKTKVLNITSLTPSFTAPTWSCKNAAFTLTSTTTNPDGSPAQSAIYSWTAGSNKYDSAGPSIQASIPKDGMDTISLIVSDTNGCQYPAVLSIIDITSPTAKFKPATVGGCVNSLITFIDSSTADPTDGPIQTWKYSFGDGSTQTFTGPPYQHQYDSTGIYAVSLLITDAKGCRDLYNYPFAIEITHPHAAFFVKDSVYCPNIPLPFIDTSTGNNIISYAWNFGDGSTSDSASPFHPFAASTTPYTVKLTITDVAGCSDSLVRTNYILAQPPIASFSMQDSVGICLPMQTTFTPNAQYYDSLYWNFGDGTSSTLPNTTHYYNSYDTFYVSLVLKGAGGCKDSATQRVLVLNPRTTTTFTYSPVKNCDSVLTNFMITPPGYTSFILYFGDGQADSSGNTSISHTYRNPSLYAPGLLLEDQSGCIVGLGGYSNITVLGAVPFFTASKKAFCDSGTVYFTNYTITNDAPIHETWDFGDGTTDSVTNPSHYYNTPGIHLVALNVTTNNNCSENFTDTIHVWQTPHPVINSTGPYCLNSPVVLQGSLTTPIIDPVIWSWTLGNGQTSSLQNPTITYDGTGSFTINLRTSVAFGCTDSTNFDLTVNPLPSIKGPATISAPVGVPVTLPFSYSSNTVSYAWTPDSNLTCSNCPNPMASPVFATTYTVTATDSNGCTATASILVKTICNDKNYFIPNTFSPNGDGVNDVFYPRGSNIYNVQSMRIFNRWGQMIFERRDFPANSQSMGWDGTINGKPAPSDAYIYILEVVCNNAQVVVLKGDVTLLR